MKIFLLSIISVSLVLLSYQLFAMHHKNKIFNKADAVSISRTGSFELDMAPDKALPLFTGPGEKIWIDHWEPTFLNGNGYEKGTVFLTSHHGHKTHWLVMNYDIKALRAVYVRVTPDLDMGTVEVVLESNQKGGSIVNVSYQLTALSQNGSQLLKEKFTQAKYDQMMKEWRSMIANNKEKINAHFSK